MNEWMDECMDRHILHAVWHAVEILSGRVGSHRWLADFPGIFFPAFVWVGLIFGLVFKRTYVIPTLYITLVKIHTSHDDYDDECNSGGRPTEVAVEYADLSASNLRRERRIS